MPCLQSKSSIDFEPMIRWTTIDDTESNQLGQVARLVRLLCRAGPARDGAFKRPRRQADRGAARLHQLPRTLSLGRILMGPYPFVSTREDDMQKYRADTRKQNRDGSVSWFAQWMGGPTLSKVSNCRTN